MSAAQPTHSTAWQVNEVDIFNVLAAHNLAPGLDDAVVEEAYRRVAPEAERVVEAATQYFDLDEQTEAANEKIEEILTEAGIITDGTKLFPNASRRLWRTWREQLLASYPNADAPAEVREAYVRALGVLRDSISPPAFPHTSPAEQLWHGIAQLDCMTRAARPYSDLSDDAAYEYVIETDLVRRLREEHGTLEFVAFFVRRDEAGRVSALWGRANLDHRGWVFPATPQTAA